MSPQKPASAAKANDALKKSPEKKAEEKPAGQNEDAEDNEPVEKGAKGEATKDMKNVTNYVKEELTNRQMDADKLAKSLSFLQETAKNHKLKVLERLTAKNSSVPVSKQNVDKMMELLQINKAEAESCLREKNDDLEAALNYWIEK